MNNWPKWIPEDERKPEKSVFNPDLSVRVLVAIPSRINNDNMQNETIAIDQFNFKQWRWGWIKPTHWMYLPPKPRGIENE